MKKIVIIGGGGHCKSVLDSLIELNEYQDIVITDKNCKESDRVLGVHVVGDDSVLGELFNKGYEYAFPAIASMDNNIVKKTIIREVRKIGYKIPSIIDKTAIVSTFSYLGEGVFVGKNVVINADAHVGEMAIINSNSLIEHECIIGEYSHISVGSVLCGQVKVGSDSFVGANSTILPCVDIGNGCIIGAGSVITKDVGDNCKVVGVNRRI